MGYRIVILIQRPALIVNNVSGNCAIAVGANERHSTTWDMLRSVTETLIATCISSPQLGTLGGTAISQAVRTRKRMGSLSRRQTGKTWFHQRLLQETERNLEMLQVAFPPTFEIAVYLQPPFNGPANTTCSWEVVASHQGDVRQCPASSAPIRPPERNLGANTTLTRNSTGQLSLVSLLNQTTGYTGAAGSGST